MVEQRIISLSEAEFFSIISRSKSQSSDQTEIRHSFRTNHSIKSSIIYYRLPDNEYFIFIICSPYFTYSYDILQFITPKSIAAPAIVLRCQKKLCLHTNIIATFYVKFCEINEIKRCNNYFIP